MDRSSRSVIHAKYRSSTLERCGQLQVNSIGITEGEDRDTETVEVRDVAVGDASLLQHRRGGFEGAPVGYSEAQVVKSSAFGVECVACGGNGSQAKQNSVCLVEDTAVQLEGVLANGGVTGVAAIIAVSSRHESRGHASARRARGPSV